MPKKKKKPRVKKHKKLSRSLAAAAADRQTDSAESVTHKGGGGLMAMRSGFKKVAGGASDNAPKSNISKAFDILLWVAVAAALGFFLYRRYN